MNRRTCLMGVLVLALLAGCETTGNIEPAALAATDKTKAVVLFTVTHDWGPLAPISGQSIGGSVRFFVELRGAGLEGGSKSAASITDPGLSSMFVQTPFDRLWGRFYVLELPAGKYELVTWRLTQQTGVGVQSFTPKVPPPTLAFELAAGTVTYIGNIHADLAWGKNPFGITLLAGGLPTVRIEAERDLELIYKTYPQLKGRVEVAPLTTGLWATEPSP